MFENRRFSCKVLYMSSILDRRFVHQFIRTSYRVSDLDLSPVTCPTWWSRLAVCTNRYKDASIDCTLLRPAAGVSLPHNFCRVEHAGRKYHAYASIFRTWYTEDIIPESFL